MFLSSRLKAFAYAARAKNVMDGVKNEEYNLYLPLILLILLFGDSIRKKDRCLFFLTIGLILHIVLTALTMPASYAKYFFEMYAFSYFFGGYMLICWINRHGSNKTSCAEKEG